MTKRQLYVIAFALFSFVIFSGFGLGDMKDKIKPNTEKCDKKKDKNKCKNKEKLKTAAKVVAIGIAAKLIYEMAVEYKSKNVDGEDVSVENYIKTNKDLPEQPEVVTYKSNIDPGKIVKVGKPTSIVSTLEVVPGKARKAFSIEERIDIYDNEDKEKVIKSLVKSVNSATQKGGIFENQFSFTLPIGMPQGIYKIKTVAIIDKKEYNSTSNDMQVVLKIMPDNQYQIALANSLGSLSQL